MSASSRVRAAALFVIGLFFAGCSLAVDFDESKIPKDEEPGATGGSIATGGSVGTGGFVGTGGAGGTFGGGTGGELGPPDASMGGSVGGTGGEPPVGTGGVNGTGGKDPGPPPPACDVDKNEGCAKDEICCAIGTVATCKKTSVSECEACGVACAPGLSSACVAGKCECAPNSGHVCTGQGAERFCSAGPPAACAECRDATDCAGRADGKSRCVAGKCELCDPGANNAGCAGKTPICDAATHTCKACTASPDDCIDPLVCTASGSCGKCGSSADCVTPTTRICDATTTECRGCASNAECAAGPQLPLCLQGVCSICHPTTEAGCNDPTKPDCRGALGGGYACQACVNNQQCQGHPGTVCDTGSGRCVACVGDNDCGGKTPFCLNNVCLACDAAVANTLLADVRCGLKAGGDPVCVRTGTQKGACGDCDPSGSRGCTNDQLCCEAAGAPACVGTTLAQCTACGTGTCNPVLSNNCSGRGCRCGSSASCSGTGDGRFCVGSPGTCQECRNDLDCGSVTEPLCESGHCVPCGQASQANTRCAAEIANTVCATMGALAGRCATCDPASNAGCSGPADQCNPATATCVDCVDNGGCFGQLDRCDVTSHTCVDCDGTGGCTAPLDRCVVATHTCVDCDATGGCAAPLDRCNLTTHTCVDCDATGGCADTPNTPICGGTSCRACANDGECAALTGSGGPLCGGNGSCGPDSPCTKNSDCTDGKHTLCVGLQVDGGGTGVCRVSAN